MTFSFARPQSESFVRKRTPRESFLHHLFTKGSSPVPDTLVTPERGVGYWYDPPTHNVPAAYSWELRTITANTQLGTLVSGTTGRRKEALSALEF
jgi:hypothetical protein